MPFCCVPGCGNKSPSLILNDITFHRLPLNNKDLLKIWINNLNLKEEDEEEEEEESVNKRVCSEHFDLQSFRQNSQTLKRCLLPGSIPYKFDSLLFRKNNLENSEGNLFLSSFLIN